MQITFPNGGIYTTSGGSLEEHEADAQRAWDEYYAAHGQVVETVAEAGGDGDAGKPAASGPATETEEPADAPVTEPGLVDKIKDELNAVEQHIADELHGDEPTELPPATPAAIAHAEELGVDLTEVEGTGADGKILKADVAAAAPSDPPAEESKS